MGPYPLYMPKIKIFATSFAGGCSPPDPEGIYFGSKDGEERQPKDQSESDNTW